MIDESHILPLRPRENPATQPIGAASSPLDREPVFTKAHGSMVRIYPDGSVIVEVQGDAMVSTRTGRLDRTEVAIRPDPTPANARGTELVK